MDKKIKLKTFSCSNRLHRFQQDGEGTPSVEWTRIAYNLTALSLIYVGTIITRKIPTRTKRFRKEKGVYKS